jgi:hypothetical protein
MPGRSGLARHEVGSPSHGCGVLIIGSPQCPDAPQQESGGPRRSFCTANLALEILRAFGSGSGRGHPARRATQHSWIEQLRSKARTTRAIPSTTRASPPTSSDVMVRGYEPCRGIAKNERYRGSLMPLQVRQNRPAAVEARTFFCSARLGEAHARCGPRAEAPAPHAFHRWGRVARRPVSRASGFLPTPGTHRGGAAPGAAPYPDRTGPRKRPRHPVVVQTTACCDLFELPLSDAPTT